MKLLFTCLLLSLQAIAFAQQDYIDYYVTFDSLSPSWVNIDVDTAYPNSKWEVGTPVKTVFTSGYGGPRALVTDTVDPCIPSDTSVVTISFPNYQYIAPWGYYVQSLSYWQNFDLDTGDVAYVGLRDHLGIYDTIRRDSNTTAGWHKVSHTIFPSLGGPLPPFFRFTLLTGNSTKTRDGWMLDSLVIRYRRATDIKEIGSNEAVSIYPNPATDVVHIRFDTPTSEQTFLTLTNSLGQLVKRKDLPPLAREVDLAVNDLPNGIYLLNLINGTGQVTKRMSIVR